MQFTKFGHTGLSVSRLCLGTATFGMQAEKSVSRAILDKAAEAGVNFIDTARSEETFKKACRKRNRGDFQMMVKQLHTN